MGYRLITINEWVGSAESRETSPEIMRAIHRIGLGDAGTCEGIWRAPTNHQINEIAAALDGTPSEYFWGSQGRDWLTTD